MNKKQKFNYRLYLTGYVFGILLITLLISSILLYLLNLNFTLGISTPVFFWIVLVSVVLGTSLTAFFSSKILAPITRLNRAMEQVADGDFSVRLETSSILEDVRTTYQKFNLMTRQLGATELLQSDFMSNVSHEVKTPVNAIEGYAMLLEDPAQTPEEQEECIRKILLNTRRLSDLVGNILLLSKVDNQAISHDEPVFRLDEQIRQAILLLEPKWTAKDIQFDVELDPVALRGNESLLLHVWTNLIDNAVKFDPPGGTVRLRLTADPHQAEFQIEDNGCGIPPEAQAHVFDRFYQADNSHRGEGSGLGLALVKRIVAFCGGSIGLDSRVGCGSRFTVTLPLQKSGRADLGGEVSENQQKLKLR